MPINDAIRGLHQPILNAFVARGQAVHRRHGVGAGHLINRATIIGSANIGRSVEISVTALQDSTLGILSAGTVETVQTFENSGGVDFENRAGSVVSAIECCAIEVSIVRLHQARLGILAVRDIEAMQRGQHAPGGDFENCSVVVGPAAIGCPIKIPICTLHHAHGL